MLGEIIAILLGGLIVGAVARLVVPGTGGMGCFATIAVGVVGGIIGGLIGRELVGDVDNRALLSLLFSVLGAILVLLVLQAVAGRRR